jgi:hypothetical protein
MGDVKRDVRALGQKITGLKAGDNVTLVLKKPKPQVDATPAKRAAKLAGDQLGLAKDVVRSLTKARDAASRGDATHAQETLASAQAALDALHADLNRAKDHATAAASDHESAPGEVKDGYGAAKDGADLAVGHLEKVADGLEKALRATHAFVAELGGRS